MSPRDGAEPFPSPVPTWNTHVVDPAVSRALDSLLPAGERTGDLISDLAEAARRSMQRRRDNSRDGGAVVDALYAEVRSWRQVQKLTGIPVTSARRWSAPPSEAES